MGTGIEVTVPSNGYDAQNSLKTSEDEFRKRNYKKSMDFDDRDAIRFPVGLFWSAEEPVVIPHAVNTDIRQIVHNNNRSLGGIAIIAIEAGHEAGADLMALPGYLAALALKAGATPEAVVKMSEGFCELLNECVSNKRIGEA